MPVTKTNYNYAVHTYSVLDATPCSSCTCSNKNCQWHQRHWSKPFYSACSIIQFSTNKFWQNKNTRFNRFVLKFYFSSCTRKKTISGHYQTTVASHCTCLRWRSVDPFERLLQIQALIGAAIKSKLKPLSFSLSFHSFPTGKAWSDSATSLMRRLWFVCKNQNQIQTQRQTITSSDSYCSPNQAAHENRYRLTCE